MAAATIPVKTSSASRLGDENGSQTDDSAPPAMARSVAIDAEVVRMTVIACSVGTSR